MSGTASQFSTRQRIHALAEYASPDGLDPLVQRTCETFNQRQAIPALPCAHPQTIELDDGTQVCTCCEACVEPIERFVMSHVDGEFIVMVPA